MVGHMGETLPFMLQRVEVMTPVPYAPLSPPEIQDNSTLMGGGLQSEMATSQENPNGSTRPRSRPVAEMEPNGLPIQMQSGLGRANRRVKCASRKAQLFFWQPVSGCPLASHAFRRVRARALPSG
jgi:hypothetical protein